MANERVNNKRRYIDTLSLPTCWWLMIAPHVL